ncbi:sulfur carrier protein ThiS [Desulforhopalus singaporensis]|uniref:Sulfur carrier protein n=1 Tax=Desulforhopalus singaporensis TaxID=91360 RepID=A0A1H0Q8K0_9BACT|nr:sulfur carrier protein ThiS [Desulforhopalus singaporensis]SDP13702.1 sulfur carrier protein [Desulforhopalus singaporensis]
MRIKINGRDQDIDTGSLTELIDQMDLPPSSLVVEHNLRLVPQDQWATTRLEEGDVLELLNFVGGG